MDKKHQKHAKLVKPLGGVYGSNEFALVGAPCADIEKLVSELVNFLPEKIAYLDADHGNTGEIPNLATFQDKISYFRIDKKQVSEIEKRFLLEDQDLILLNGNHFKADKQVVLIHSKKEESLKKRIGELSHVVAFVLFDEIEKPFDWLYEHLADAHNIPVIYFKEINLMAQTLLSNLNSVPLNGLILTGGKSTRMGNNKSLINYHGKPQAQYLFEMLESIGISTYISTSKENINDFDIPPIEDSFLGLGPYGGILSAFKNNPNSAWIVLACDMPFIDLEAIQDLVKSRNASKVATAYLNPETGFPDPLFTIFEPKAYSKMLVYLSAGFSCPRKVLINSDINLIKTQDSIVLKNVNTLEEMQEVKRLLVQ